MSKSRIMFNILCFILVSGIINQQIDYRSVYQTSSACLNGRLQSPLDLQQFESSFSTNMHVTTDTYTVVPNAQLNFTGKVIEIIQSSDNTTSPNFGYVGFLRNGILKQYSLTNIEIHYPGEHQIEGQQPDVEIMFVHKKNLAFQTSLNQYRKIPDSNMYLTISILYRSTSTLTDNGFMSDLLSTWSGYTSQNNFSFRSSINLDIESYNILDERAAYFYDGSFTTTPCDETVNRIVYRDMYYIASSDLNLIKSIYQNYYINGVTNKGLAQYYGRPITRNFMNMTEGATAATSSYLKTMSVVGLFLISVLLF